MLESWCGLYINYEQLPSQRTVVRFDFPDLPTKGNQAWMIFHGHDSEVCRTHPGFNEDLVVVAQSRAFAEWHLGRITWVGALQSQQIVVHGPSHLAKALPQWNKQSGWAHLDIDRPT